MIGAPAGGWMGLPNIAAYIAATQQPAASGEPPRLSVAAQNQMTAAQIVTPTPKPSECMDCRTKDAIMSAREDVMSKMNALIDDQAAQIVALQATAALGPQVNHSGDTIAKLQASDTVQRRNIAIAEKRVLQLLKALQDAKIDVPDEYTNAEWNRGTWG